MLFVIILDHVTCSRRMVVELQCRFQKYELYISGQIDICKLCRTQNSINFCNNGILTIFWIIPGIGIQTSSDCRAICSGCGFFFFLGLFVFFFFFPWFQLFLLSVAILFNPFHPGQLMKLNGQYSSCQSYKISA